MIDLKKVKKIIADTIYDDLACTFCDDCRYDKEITNYSECENCSIFGKNNWAISHKESNAVAEKIVENVFKDLFNW